MKHIIIVGGGLVGGLNALYLAKRGHKVDVYEAREDIRKSPLVRGRSINLALSVRGIDALAKVGLDKTVLETGVPMYNRCLHNVDGSLKFIPYGTRNECLVSIDRRRLNELLLSEAEKHPNVSTYFGHRMVDGEIDAAQVTFNTTSGENVTAQGDLIIGCDGAHSGVRKAMMKSARLDFSQGYIPHGFVELRIPPTKNNEYAMEKNALHIWPRHDFMLVAFPNVEDTSFVTSLLMPYGYFDSMKTEKDLISFFEKHLPDAIPLIGREYLIQMFFSVKPSPLLTVKCSPNHVNSTGLLIGDAAHAMVPFYGQGMNAAFEDCIVLDDLMNKYSEDLEKVLQEYSRFRTPDVLTMCDLAVANYVEMRSNVAKPQFVRRIWLDKLMQKMMPETWIPMYTMVVFSRMRYTDCVKRRAWQDEMLQKVFYLLCMFMLLFAVLGFWIRQDDVKTGLNRFFDFL